MSSFKLDKATRPAVFRKLARLSQAHQASLKEELWKLCSSMIQRLACRIARAAGEAVGHLPILNQHSFRDTGLQKLLTLAHSAAAPHA